MELLIAILLGLSAPAEPDTTSGDQVQTQNAAVATRPGGGSGGGWVDE